MESGRVVACVVWENIEIAEFSQGFVHGFGNVGLVSYVELDHFKVIQLSQ